MHEQKAVSYETELQKLRSQIAQLEQTKGDDSSATTISNVEYEKLKNENNTLLTMNETIKKEMENLNKEIANLKTDKDFIEEESIILRQEKDDLTKQLETQRNLNQELQVHNQELNEQMKLLATNNTSDKTLDSDHDDIENLQLDVERLTTMLTKTTIEIEDLNMTVETLTKERDCLLYEKDELLLQQHQDDNLNGETTDTENIEDKVDELLMLQKRFEELTIEKNLIDEKYELLTEQVSCIRFKIFFKILKSDSLSCALVYFVFDVII